MDHRGLVWAHSVAKGINSIVGDTTAATITRRMRPTDVALEASECEGGEGIIGAKCTFVGGYQIIQGASSPTSVGRGRRHRRCAVSESGRE